MTAYTFTSDEARNYRREGCLLFFFLPPLLSFFFLLMAVGRA
jgi:hypothetical protein